MSKITAGHAGERPVVDDPRWARMVARDKSADGEFWYSVATTRVYCRPSCPSHTAPTASASAWPSGEP